MSKLAVESRCNIAVETDTGVTQGYSSVGEFANAPVCSNDSLAMNASNPLQLVV